MGMAGFTDEELAVLALRVNGAKPEEIAARLGCTRPHVNYAMWCVRHKTGLQDLATLTRWALEWGLDVVPDLSTPREAGKRGSYRRASLDIKYAE